MSRRAAGLALAVLALLGIVVYARTAAPIITDGDLAVTELYTELASEGRLLVGPYSRFGWHHPGPIYFFVQAIPYVLGGRAAASLYATAVAINVAALAILSWILLRVQRGFLALLIPAACVMLAGRASTLLASPWTAHVPILASVSFIVVCAAAVAGRTRLVPLMLGIGSFVVQMHLAFVPMVAALALAAVARAMFDRDDAGRPRWSVLIAAAAVLVVLWLPVVVEAALHRGGNLAALWSFFVTAPGSGHGYLDAFLNWSYGINGVVRPEFDLPWGGHFAFDLEDSAWTLRYAMVQMLAVAAIAWIDFRGGRRFEAWLAVLALTASAIGWWSLTRIRDDILDHEILPLAALGALNFALIVGAVLRRVSRQWETRRSMVVPAGAILLVACALGLFQLQDFTGFERRRSDRPSVLSSYGAIRDYLSAEHVRRPLVEMEGATWSHAAGVILRLRQADVSCAVRDEAIPMFTRAFASNGREDALLTIGTRARHRELAARPGNTVLRDRDPAYIDIIKVAPGTLSR